VLLGGAEPPPAETLPEGLRPLCELEAHRFIGKDADWQARFERLRERLAVIPGLPAPRFRLPSGQAQPFRVIEHLAVGERDPHPDAGRRRRIAAARLCVCPTDRDAKPNFFGGWQRNLLLEWDNCKIP